MYIDLIMRSIYIHLNQIIGFLANRQHPHFDFCIRKESKDIFAGPFIFYREIIDVAIYQLKSRFSIQVWAHSRSVVIE